MLFQWVCSGTPCDGMCFPDNRFLASCHLLETSSPNYLGSLIKVNNGTYCLRKRIEKFLMSVGNTKEVGKEMRTKMKERI